MEQIQHIEIGRIVANPQVRKTFDESSLASMAESLAAVGQLQPVRVRQSGEKFVVVDGERRLRAGLIAKLTTLAVIVEVEKLDDADVLIRQLVANIQREDLTPLEKARGIHSLMKQLKCNCSEVAKRVAMSAATVTRLLALLTLPDELQRRVETGDIPASAAYELSRIDNPAERDTHADALADGRLTRDGLVAASKSARRLGGEKPIAAAARVTAMLGQGRSVTVVSQNLNLDSFIAVLEDLLSRARRIRPQGLTLQTFAKMLKEQCQPSLSAPAAGGLHE